MTSLNIVVDTIRCHGDWTLTPNCARDNGGPFPRKFEFLKWTNQKPMHLIKI